MDRSITSEFGKIKIHRKAIRQLIEQIALRINGIKAVGWQCEGKIKGFFLKLFELDGTRIFYTKNIKGNIPTDNELRVVIPVTISLNVNLVDTAYQLQKEIFETLRENLEIENIRVDVKIKKIQKEDK